jgi:hypothetical protein
MRGKNLVLKIYDKSVDVVVGGGGGLVEWWVSDYGGERMVSNIV